MKIAVRCLYLLAVAIICESSTVSEEESEELKNLQLDKPDGCEITTSWLLGHTMTCPGFKMEMAVYNETNLSGQLEEELRSTVECSFNSSPYKYLRLTNSKRNSLMLKKCPPPEHGSFSEGWPNLDSFKFENYENIDPLTRQHFSGLNGIRTLILFISTDHHMPDDILNDLTNVKEIHLSVHEANKNIFKNLNKLEWLHLSIESNDSLADFDTSEMKNLPAFKTLELTSNSFRRLTKRFFEGCPYVETLIFKHNSFDEIDANAFEPLTNLKDVSFKWNKVKSLPEGLFSTNKKLETFTIFPELFARSFTSLPSGLFSNLPNLREISIQSTLYSIPGNLIHGSTNLELLDLQFNKLYSLPRNLLENHTKLKKIKLYGNEFGDTPSRNLFDNKSPLTEILFDYEDD